MEAKGAAARASARGERPEEEGEDEERRRE